MPVTDYHPRPKPQQRKTHETRSEHLEFFAKFPVWHGLRLASTILGTGDNGVPETGAAHVAFDSYEQRLASIVRAVEAQGPHAKDGYADQMLSAWRAAKEE